MSADWSRGLRLIAALAIAPLVWPFLVLLRTYAGTPSDWDLGFLPITLAVHAFVAYLAFLLLALPAAVYLARDGRRWLAPGFLTGVGCGLATLAITSYLAGPRLSPGNAALAAVGGGLAMLVFAGLAPPPAERGSP